MFENTKARIMPELFQGDDDGVFYKIIGMAGVFLQIR